LRQWTNIGCLAIEATGYFVAVHNKIAIYGLSDDEFGLFRKMD